MGSYPSGAMGRARVDPHRPTAFAICDRCSFRYNRTDLSWQFDWRGSQLQNLRILVCDRCLDVPQEQLRSYSPPPDPIPVRNPRPDQSLMGYAPLVGYTVACTAAVWLRDGLGNLVLDGLGNPIMGVPGTSAVLLPAATDRALVNFTLPSSFGLWLNSTGPADPLPSPGSVFYAPGSYYEVFGAAANNEITYYTTIAGLQIVVQTQ